MKYFVKYRISENISETPEGFLICIGVPIARTGEMVYGKDEVPLDPGDDGTVKITRDESEVFRAETIASFEGKPITIKHPEDFVNPDNWKDLAKGSMQNVRRGKGDEKNSLIADLLITDKMAIELVKNGLREVSCGYEADYVQDVKGKGKQKNIVGNHLALVNQGRAGSGYAINDHKGADEMKKTLGDRIKAIFSKAQDEALKAADEAKEKKGKTQDDDEDDETTDANAYDELVRMVGDLGEKIDAMKKGKDQSVGETTKKDNTAAEDDEDKTDDDGSLEERMTALETCVKKLLEGKSSDEKKDDEDKTDDADEDDDTEDDDFDESTMVGDEADVASRAEILAPGLKVTKDIKAKALKKAYESDEGKKVIDQLTGGKPTFDSAEKVDMLFISASEMLKAVRTRDMVKTKVVDYASPLDNDGPMTAEKLNEVNAKFYNQKQA